MKYLLLGNSGLRVSELCLGTMTFGKEWEWGADEKTSRQIIEAFAEKGGNFLDTANFYTEGTSEKILSGAIAEDRDYWVVATKYSLVTANHVNGCGNHRKNMIQAVEQSLKRLKTDYIDLYWLHAWDFTTPIEEVMRAFDDLVRAGKLLYIGISDTPAWIVAQGQTLASLRGWTPFAGLQIEYSLVERTGERDLLPMANSLGIGVTAWSPLGQGVLTGKYNRKNAEEDARLAREDAMPYVNERNLRIAAEVMKVADEAGRTPAQVALRWIMQQPGAPIPIIGGRKIEQIEDNLAATEFELTQEQIGRLNHASEIDPGFPHEFLASDRVHSFGFGGQLEKIIRQTR